MNYSDTFNDNSVKRFDAEYFKKEYLKEDSLLAKIKYKYLGDISFITDGQHGYHEVDENSPIRHLKAQNFKNWFAVDNNAERIAKWVDDNNKRSSLETDDIILTTRGSVGFCAIVKDDVLPANIDQDVARIKLNYNAEIISQYLLTYINSRLGQDWTKRNQTGMVQQGLSLWRVREFPIPVLSKGFQVNVKAIIESSKYQKDISQYKYSEAETLLLQEIGLNFFEQSKELVNIKSFKDSFGVTGRLDAEYYQPKYEVITNAIKNYKNGFTTLESFIYNYSTGFPYKSETYSDIEGIPLIRINNISKGNLDLSNAVYIPFNDIDLSKKDIANENDILISMSGTIGNSCKIRKGIRAVVNQRIMRITPKNYNVDVLPLIINSIIGQLQLERIGTGGVQTNISATDIKEILVPIIADNKQEQIAELVEESFKLKAESVRLLEVAKKAVEMAIEENEENALNFINKNN